MSNKYFTKFVSLFLILLFCVLFLPLSNVKAQTPLNPGSVYSYDYDKNTNLVTEYNVSAGTKTKSGHTFSKPVGIEAGTMAPVEMSDCSLGVKDSAMMFKLDQTTLPIYLGIGLEKHQTCGLFYKDPKSYIWHTLKARDDGSMLIQGLDEVGAKIEINDAALRQYIISMNGLWKNEIRLDDYPKNGNLRDVGNLVSTEKITDSTILCGSITADSKIFNKNTNIYNKLPDDIKLKIDNNTFTIKDILSKTKLFVFLKYSNGYDANGNYKGWTNAAFGTQSYKIPVLDNGTFQSENLKGLPVGKYKISGVMYVRNDNPADATTKSRFDSPETGWWKDFLADFAGLKDAIDVYQISPVFETEVAASGNTKQGFKQSDGMANCLPLTYRFGATQDTYSMYTDADKTDNCKAKNSASISGMISEGFCGLTVVLKKAADTFFKWAVGYMEGSIGIARDKGGTIDDAINPAASTGGAGGTGGAATGGAITSTDLSSAVASATSNSPKEFRGVLKLNAELFNQANKVNGKTLAATVRVIIGEEVFEYSGKITYYEPDPTNNKIKAKVTCTDNNYINKLNSSDSPKIMANEKDLVNTKTIFSATKSQLIAKWGSGGFPPDLNVILSQ